jgi:hypothetical protein
MQRKGESRLIETFFPIGKKTEDMLLDDVYTFFLHLLYLITILYLILMIPNVIMAMCDVARREVRRNPVKNFPLNPGNLTYICISAILVGGFVFIHPFINVIGYLLCELNPILALFTDFRFPEISTRVRMGIVHDVGRGWRVRISLIH